MTHAASTTTFDVPDLEFLWSISFGQVIALFAIIICTWILTRKFDADLRRIDGLVFRIEMVERQIERIEDTILATFTGERGKDADNTND